MPILQEENDDIVRINGLAIEDYSDSLGGYLSTVAEETFELNPTTSIVRTLDLNKAYQDPDDELVDFQELNAEYGHLGLKFEGNVTRGYAELLAQGKEEERARQSALARAQCSNRPESQIKHNPVRPWTV